jgi:ClpP class serine protease
MNITLSIDETLAERARAVAAGRGKSLNQFVRELLEAETGLHDGAARARQLDELWASSPGRSAGRRIRREDA